MVLKGDFGFGVDGIFTRVQWLKGDHEQLNLLILDYFFFVFISPTPLKFN